MKLVFIYLFNKCLLNIKHRVINLNFFNILPVTIRRQTQNCISNGVLKALSRD